MLRWISSVGLTLAALSLPALAQAHYLPGVLPIQAETTMSPYPGLYFSEFLANYNGDVNLDRSFLNGRVPVSLNVNTNITAVNSLFMWQTGEKVLGADYGVMAIVPFQNNAFGSKLEVGLLNGTAGARSSYGLGDIYVSPLMLGWHGEQFDAQFSYGVYLPTGAYSTTNAVENRGRGFSTHQLQAGGSYYLDEERTWSLNGVATFEASTSNARLNPGNYLTFDWAIMKKLDENWKIGVTGYDTRQLTPISGLPAGLLSNFTNRADAIGGEVNLTLPEANHLTMTLKYAHEYNHFGRFGGNVASFSLSFPIEMELPEKPEVESGSGAPAGE